VKDFTGSYAGGLYGLAALCIISAVVCALFLDIPDPAAAARGGAVKAGAH
jgi:ACS family tartrate transporter-like MFS transporter